jgi:hypothetical protein
MQVRHTIFAQQNAKNNLNLDQNNMRVLHKKFGVPVSDGTPFVAAENWPEGPTRCSGLDVMRYDAESLHGQFGARYRLVESSKELHSTPFGTTQQFLYCYCRIE